MAVSLAWYIATWLARKAPLRGAYLCAGLAADLIFFGWREKRENTIDNMAHILRGADRGAIRTAARQSFRNYAKYVVDFLRAPNLRSEDLEGKVVFKDWDVLEAARAEGKGILIVLMHFGNWDMGGPVLSQHGYPVNVIAETMEHDRLNHMIVSARTVQGMHVIPMERSAIGILRALRRNEVLGVLIDRPMSDNGVVVNFFGAPISVPAGPARIALLTGARVFPSAMVRLRGATDRLMAVVDTSIRVERTGNDQEDVRALTEAIMAAHERIIRRYPEQWYMFRRFWPEHLQRLGRQPALVSEA